VDYLSEPLGPDFVSTYERTFGIELPPSYRAFLLQVGDGGAGPGLGMRELGRPLDDAAQWEVGEIATDEGEPDLLMRSKFDPLGAAALEPSRPPYYTTGVRYLFDHGCGLWDVLVVNGPHAGQIFHDARPDRTGFFRYALDERGAIARLRAEAGADSLDFAEYYCWWLSVSAGAG
jgi:hypothetical protein